MIVRTHAGRTRLLGECLASIDAQEYRNLEVVVVEDGSREAAALVDGFASATDLAVVYRSIARGGRCRAGNAGLETARGAWLNFLDDDDQLLPNHCLSLLRAAMSRPDVIAAVGRSLEVPTVFHSLDPLRYEELDHRPFRVGPFSRARLWRENFLPIQSVLFRRELYEAHGGFDVALGLMEDWDLWVRYLSSGRVETVEELTSLFRVPGDPRAQRRRQALLSRCDVRVKQKQHDVRVSLTVAEVIETARQWCGIEDPAVRAVFRLRAFFGATPLRRLVGRMLWRSLAAPLRLARRLRQAIAPASPFGAKDRRQHAPPPSFPLGAAGREPASATATACDQALLLDGWPALGQLPARPEDRRPKHDDMEDPSRMQLQPTA